MRAPSVTARAFSFALALLLAPGCRTAPPPVSQFGAGTEELVKRQNEFNQAFSLRDAAKLESLMAPEYTFHFYMQDVTGSARPAPNAPRGKWSGDLFARLSNGPLEWSLVDARIHGGLGFVVSHYRWMGAFDGRSFLYQGYITDVWIRRSGTWKILESSASLLPQR